MLIIANDGNDALMVIDERRVLKVHRSSHADHEACRNRVQSMQFLGMKIQEDLSDICQAIKYYIDILY